MLVVACPGQGAQKPGFLESWLGVDGVRESLSAFGETIGLDIIAHGTTSDEDTIKDTAVAQPLLTAAALATYAAVFGEDTRPDFAAGHSVGEIAAASIAGIVSPDDAARFVSLRANGMAEASNASPTGMAAVVGGTPEDVLAAIEAADLTAANVNGGGQTVAAGSLENIGRLVENPPERARVIPLKVAGAFHTSYMEQAQAPLRELAASLTVSDPTVPILTNSTGAVIDSGAEYLELLISQVTSPVRWDLCQETLAGRGVTGMLELSPGGTLTGLAKRALKGLETFALRSAEDLDAARDFVAVHKNRK